MLKGFWSYTGFSKPIKIGDTFEELFENTVTTFDTLTVSVELENDPLKEDLIDLLECLNLTNFDDLDEKDVNGVWFMYGVYYNPTVEDFIEFNKTVCLSDFEYLEELL